MSGNPNQPCTKRRKLNTDSSSVNAFTNEDLQLCLFGKSNFICASLQERPVMKVNSPDREPPNIVRVCLSTIPGADYGIQATQVIAEGAWIGPYKGRLVKPDEGGPGLDSSWEIYKDGKLQAYIDGSDTISSSWMRLIRCARHKQEQNLYAFQYREKIYYRVYKTIYPGQELLVWYDDMYTQYLGLPCAGIYDMASAKGPTKFPGNLVVFAQEESLPVTPPTSPAHDQLPTDAVDVTNNDQHSLQQVSSPSLLPSSVLLSERGLSNQKDDDGKVMSLGGIGNGRKENHLCLVNDRTVEHHTSTNTIIAPSDSLSSSSVNLSSSHEESVQCGQCKKQFSQRSLLQTHKCPSITNKPYQCGHCDERFSNPGEMTVHVAIHQDKKPFKCGYCSRSFTGATTLNNHVRMHTGERPFDCHRCGKTFTKGLQLSRHQKIPGHCQPFIK